MLQTGVLVINGLRMRSYKMYKLGALGFNNIQNIIRLSDGVSIPPDEANTDYQAYLAWIEESPDNVPLPADE